MVMSDDGAGPGDKWEDLLLRASYSTNHIMVFTSIRSYEDEHHKKN